MAALSVVIPAHNEADGLSASLANLHAGLAPLGTDYEILVVDNASTDCTADVARAGGARVATEPYRQISRARNTGAAAASGNWLLFVDADTWPSIDLLKAAIRQLEAGACGGGALVEMDALPDRVYRVTLSMWNGMSRRCRLAAGCFLFASREAFDAVGGFDTRYYAGDEVAISWKLRRWGRARDQPFVVMESPRVKTSARKAQWFSPLQHVLTMLLVVLCPPAARSRRLMWFWYQRPTTRR